MKLTSAAKNYSLVNKIACAGGVVCDCRVINDNGRLNCDVMIQFFSPILAIQPVVDDSNTRESDNSELRVIPRRHDQIMQGDGTGSSLDGLNG